jgi:hypothetical protein
LKESISPWRDWSAMEPQFDARTAGPSPGDIGSVVILPGGEAGILKSWWNADDETEWRWQLEFYNHT